jgi:hypothetical protein
MLKKILFFGILSVLILQQAFPAFGSSLQQIVRNVRASVVTVFAGPVTGTGFVVAPTGYAITCAHVVDSMGSVNIKTYSGATSLAKVKYLDKSKDIAVLEIMGNLKIPNLSLAKKTPSLGEDIFVIGTPRGLEQTLSKGIISSVRTQGADNIIQFDAAVSSGSSGSPVFNMQGEVVGIVQASLTDSQNLNFAFASTSIIPIISRLPGQTPKITASTKKDPQQKTPTQATSTASGKVIEKMIRNYINGYLETYDYEAFFVNELVKNYLDDEMGMRHYFIMMERVRKHIRGTCSVFLLIDRSGTKLKPSREFNLITDIMSKANFLSIPINKYLVLAEEIKRLIYESSDEYSRLSNKVLELERMTSRVWSSWPDRGRHLPALREARHECSLFYENVEQKVKRKMEILYDMMENDLRILAKQL